MFNIQKRLLLKKYHRRLKNLKTKHDAANDRVQKLKKEVVRLERQVLNKKEEMDKAHGAAKRITGGEIERLFEDLDRRQNRENILASTCQKLAGTISKIEDLIATLAEGTTEDLHDDIAIELEDTFEIANRTDEAFERMEQTEYKPRTAKEIDVEERTAKIEDETKEDQPLKENTKRRLEELQAMDE